MTSGHDRRCQQLVPPLRRCRPIVRYRIGSQLDRIVSNRLIPIEQPSGRHDVDVTTEQLAELVFEMKQIEQRATSFELHEKIDITGWAVLASSDGPEHRDGHGLVLLRDGKDLVALSLDERA